MQKEELVRANRLVERDVRRIRTRNECLERIRYLKQKKSWMVTYGPSSFPAVICLKWLCVVGVRRSTQRVCYCKGGT